MANMVSSDFWQKRKVLVTGHTGFKGSWLCVLLDALGAEVHGLALQPPTQPNLFTLARIDALLASDTRADIRDAEKVQACLQQVAPQTIFHLAAQPLVRQGYAAPVETYAVNVLGTAHVLDAVRNCSSVQSVVIATTDKCYENREWIRPYRETDNLGGHDPYSNSKACAELVTQSFRDSFFASPDSPRIASARAGNVIGGGDWAPDRLIPDCVRAWVQNESVTLRYPAAVRPWQHVLEPLTGYIMLAEALGADNGVEFARAWNFGPALEDASSVGDVAAAVCKQLRISLQMPIETPEQHEAGLLRLDSTQAQTRLGWQPRWHLERTLQETVAWYRHWHEGGDMLSFSREQIRHYQAGNQERN